MAGRALRIEVEGTAVEVAVREAARARRLTIRVSADRAAEIVVPPGTGRRQIERALRRHRDWIARKAEEMEARTAGRPRLGLDRPGVVWVGGEAVPIERRGGGRPMAGIERGRLAVAGPAQSAAAAIERWYRREARRRARARVEAHWEPVGVRPQRISVRDQRTRWGSCTARGTLSFSWRLLLAPPAILDYVVVHELCHLRELNHSPAFWSLLERTRPGWRAEAAWLRDHGWELGAYRPRLSG
jgi:predicted metal-dependent hydrolase